MHWIISWYSIVLYGTAMRRYDELNPPSWTEQGSAFVAEAQEFIEAMQGCDFAEASSEFFDCMHSLMRFLVVCIRSIPWIGTTLYYFAVWLPVLAFPTALKHARRYAKHQCIRSSRHCLMGDHVCSGSVIWTTG